MIIPLQQYRVAVHQGEEITDKGATTVEDAEYILVRTSLVLLGVVHVPGFQLALRSRLWLQASRAKLGISGCALAPDICRSGTYLG